ncbi:hypothetical protein GGI12_003053 [Dipsacomyces acuminosporus]|nr:hypothetical protein GGI12_003053 [Dipsacomyces acuminosporus]
MSSACISSSRAASSTAGKSAGTAVGVGKSSSESTVQTKVKLEDAQSLAPKSEAAKRKHSVIITTSSGEFDLSDLPPPRPGRPSGKIPQDPAMQEARKRARVLRNRAAAQLSREKKRQHLELLEKENGELRLQNADLEKRLSSAESTNLELSAKLDSLAKQFQNFQNLFLAGQVQPQQQQHQQGQTPVLDWSSISTPVVSTPLAHPLHSAQTTAGPSDSAFSLTSANTTSTTATPTTTTTTTETAAAMSAPESSSILAAMAGTTVASTASIAPSPALELFPNAVAASSELSGNGLSEPAALAQSDAHIFCVAIATFGEFLPATFQQEGGSSSSSVGDFFNQFINELAATSGQHSSERNSVGIAAEQSSDALDSILCDMVGALPKWRVDQQTPAFSNSSWDLEVSPSSTDDGGDDDAMMAKLSARPFGTRRSSYSRRSGGLNSLRVVISWLDAGSSTSTALRRTVGDGPVDKVSSLVSSLYTLARSIEGRQHRDKAPSTPPHEAAASPVSTRLRSRVKPQSSFDELESAAAIAEPKTPTTRGRRSVLRKNVSASASDLSEDSAATPAPATPSRRSTRAAARKATDLIQDDVAELMGSRKRVTAPAAAATRKTPATAKKMASITSVSSGDEAPSTPTRRATRAASRKSTRASSPVAISSEEENAMPELLQSPRARRSTRRIAATATTSEADNSQIDSVVVEVKTPGRRKRQTKITAAFTSKPEVNPEADVNVAVAETLAAISEHEDNESTEAKDRQEQTDSLAVGLPPPHPNLAEAATAAQAVDKPALVSGSQSVDENYHTAPESPVKSIQSIAETQEGDSVPAAAAVAEEARNDVNEHANEGDDISDLSDVDDPHFTEIMTTAAATATLSAAESLDVADSVSGMSDQEEPAAKSSHVVFDSDKELESDDDDDNGVPEVASAKKPGRPTHPDADSDSDDEAPEVVSTKPTAPSPSHYSRKEIAETKAVVPDNDDADGKQQPKKKKKHRARHRKRAVVSSSVVQEISANMDKVAKLKRPPGLERPAEIPEELRLENDKSFGEASKARVVKRPTAGEKLDMAVLTEFAKESKKRSKGDVDQETEDRSAKKRKKDKTKEKKKKSKKQQQKDSRVVSGIRVVSTKPAKKTSLLASLSQTVPDSARNFSKKKRGNSDLRRSNPLIGIARSSNQPAISFFK